MPINSELSYLFLGILIAIGVQIFYDLAMNRIDDYTETKSRKKGYLPKFFVGVIIFAIVTFIYLLISS